MAADSFLTITAPSKGLFREKGSKFHGFAFPCQSEEQVREHLDALRREYFDATHHCYAWVLGPDQERHRANDDGEPHHSAGDPILAAIRSRNLTNVLVVVVRYFGGTKLGVGGLVTAYRASAEEALRMALVVREDIRRTLRVTFSYEATAEIMRLVRQFDAEVSNPSYGEQTQLHLQIKRSLASSLEEKLGVFVARGFPVAYQWEDISS